MANPVGGNLQKAGVKEHVQEAVAEQHADQRGGSAGAVARERD